MPPSLPPRLKFFPGLSPETPPLRHGSCFRLIHGQGCATVLRLVDAQDLPAQARALSAGKEEERQCDAMDGLGFIELRGVPR